MPTEEEDRKVEPKEFVLFSARLMAAKRARETEQPDHLFEDPFAAKLAGSEALAFMEQQSTKQDLSYVAVRTRFFDDFLMAAMFEASQVVILGAGMDARAFRLPFPCGTKVYEIDQPEVLGNKEAILKNTLTTCQRHVIAADLTQPWSQSLLAQGYQADLPSIYLIEGLLMYLTEPEVHDLLKTISELTATGSWLGLDLINVKSIQYKSYQGYFRSGCDNPEELLSGYGWDANVVQPGDEGAHFGRYTEKLPPRDVPDVERAFLVKAKKKGS